MNRIIYVAWIVFMVTFLNSGCNIVPKSVQYQKEEEKVLGSIDIVNPVVEEIQVVLNGLGYETGNTDGRMGQKTREAIREFQESIGLKNTGYIDTFTLRQIEDIRRVNEERELKGGYKVDVRTASSGKEGSSLTEFRPTIKDVQTALKNAGFDPGAIDGKMGPKTRQAIKEFQRTKGLNPDGVVGSRTWAELGKYINH
ncbi:MAG: peptidoglycan-binding protein [Candidatus Omnitrophica bacterium]|nr:peptidoglycan-binding protein [Candidatus Omnitrophota bacterium]